jgi:hypothetical protein
MILLQLRMPSLQLLSLLLGRRYVLQLLRVSVCSAVGLVRLIGVPQGLLYAAACSCSCDWRCFLPELMLLTVVLLSAALQPVPFLPVFRVGMLFPPRWILPCPQA